MKEPKRLTAEIKKTLGPVTGSTTDEDIRVWFNYKNVNSYSSSPKKPWIENGLLCFLDRVKANFILIPKDEGKAILAAFEDLARISVNESLTPEEEEIIEAIKKQL